jgi:photosystem II stability/assembly factor-like uncharacterized protein
MKRVTVVCALACLMALLSGAVARQTSAQAGATQESKAGQPPARKAPAKAPQKAEVQQARPEARPQAEAEAGQRGEGAPEERGPMSSRTFNGLRLRNIGPALTSGRIAALAVDPNNRSYYIVAAASGGVWKTTNAGTTFAPIFDSEGSYSIGAVTLDPKNPSIIWVGTGENNSQRSVGYGDGVYKSEDGGRSWRNLGLKNSEHIARILIDPRDSNIVYVAAQGPLWGPGGDRGLYKSTDGGKTWKAVLSISENTGVTDVVMDPSNPDTLFAAAYQRRRHVWTLINGGPESGIHRSTDGGATWTRLRSGLPTEDMGRIGLAISPANPRIVYAQIEAANRRGGTYRSEDSGATWERRNEFDSTAMYYGKIFADPKDADRIYVMNVRIMVSDEGGRNIRPLGERSKHVDNHALWIDPKYTNYYLAGCDGGLYESFDRGANWHFKANLPIPQFYAVAVDNSQPFYYVYGGTQDNNSLGGPSRTRNASGITNYDWFITQGGDGFRSQIDPNDPNTVYAQSQYGGLVRYDRATGERMGIQPQPGKGEPPLRWNWDSPLIISPHSPMRLYFAANVLFRSDNRGDAWRAISGELSRGIDRDTLPVMGRVWGVDAVARHASTSFYGNATALAESPLKEGLLIVGTDDGLVHVTEDGGKTWRKIESFPGVPEKTFTSRIAASQHEASTFYAAFNNHKNSDFKPYLLKTTDLGKTWTSIAGNLPANGPVWAIAEDHVNPSLLFVGTEFGLFFTLDGGQKWVRLRGGFPTIAVRDLAIQKRENDLVVASFGRGIYILDNYTPLRGLREEALKKDALLFPVKDALMYIQATPLGGGGRGSQGASFYVADNPPFGAMFTYFLKDPLRTRRQRRQEAEREAVRKGAAPKIATPEELRAEEEEEAPAILLSITDDAGNVIRRLTGPATAGIHRVTWDLRDPAASLGPARRPDADEPEEEAQVTPGGPLVMPGTYRVTLSRRVEGKTQDLAGPETFQVMVLGQAAMSTADRAELVDFQRRVMKLQRAVSGALQAADSLRARMPQIHRAIQETPGAGQSLKDEAMAIDRKLSGILLHLRGDSVMRSRNYNTPPSISDRVSSIVGAQRMSASRPTQTQRDAYKIAAEEFAAELAALRALVESDLARLEKQLNAIGAPWTPGRIPEWKD